MTSEDTDLGPLDGETPLTRSEIKRLRSLLRADDRATWVRSQIKIITPWLISLAVGIYTAINWAVEHIKWGTK